MFRRGKNKGKGPLANQLRGASEPNTLSNWSVDDATADLEPDDDEFDEAEELEDESEADDVEAVDDRTPAQRQADLQAELERQAEEFGLLGDNPVGLYGPNGEDVASLIESLPTIDYDTAEAIADAYEAASEAERKVAQSVIRRRHRNGKLAYELDAAERAVSDWRSSLMIGDEDAELFGIVANAATDAVDALVLEEELDDADFATLYGPWSDVMDVEEDEEDGDEEPAEDDEAEAAGDGTKADAEADEEASDEADEGMFGPNTEIVTQFLHKLSDLGTVDISELVAAWREQPKEELRLAHRSLQELADEDAKWREQLRLAQDEVFAWMDHRPTALFSRYAAATDTRSREIAGPAVADAIAALVMADIMEPEDAQTLYAPWLGVIGEPALPAYEEDDEEEDAAEAEQPATEPEPRAKRPKK